MMAYLSSSSSTFVRSVLYWSFFLVVWLLLWMPNGGCQAQTATLGQLINETTTAELSSLFSVLQLADLLVTLNGEGPFTMFGPDDTAIREFENPELFTKYVTEASYRQHLKSLLLYHVASGSYTSDQIVALSNLTMLNGEAITIEASASGTDGSETLIQINDRALKIIDDLTATNGILHVIDAVLLPPFLQTNVMDVIQDKEPLAGRLFTAALDLTQELAAASEVTVLVPSSTALSALDRDFSTFLQVDEGKEVLKQILSYHVIVQQVVPSNAFENGDELPTYFANVTLSVQTNSGDDGVVVTSFNNNDAATLNATMVDLVANNGIVHVIDQVLWPPTILGYMASTPSMSTLFQAIVAAGAVESLTILNGAPTTAFLPNNDAFAALDTQLWEKLLSQAPWKEHLKNILYYHLTIGSLNSTQLAGVDELVMSNTEIANVTVDDSNGNLLINQATVVEADAAVPLNGIIHVIDSVLLPSFLTLNIVDVIRDKFPILDEFVAMAQLKETLSSTDGLTIFAPSQAAFDALDNITLALLQRDDQAEYLVRVLKSHVVATVISLDSLETGSTTVPTLLEGMKLTITKSTNGDIAVNGASVVSGERNILARNGIVQGIDGVLMPTDESSPPSGVARTSLPRTVGAGLVVVLGTFLMLIL
ncbi:hypothetical protein ACA910_006323 [Epithemia clementina (nom. ined.)]